MSSETVFKVLAVVTAMGGVACFMSAFIPTTLTTYRTRNTVGINRKMFFLHFLAGVFFFLGAIPLIVAGSGGGSGGGWDLIVSGILFTTNSLCGWVGCLYTLLLKIKNAKAATEAGITEQEYHERTYAHLVTQETKLAE